MEMPDGLNGAGCWFHRRCVLIPLELPDADTDG
jgi:hypothetical protein